MNRIITILAVLISPLCTKAQITVTDADFAVAGDTFRMSIAPLSTVIDLTVTGPNQTWDYSTLTRDTQVVDNYLNVSNTGLVFSLFFANVGFNPNRASVALAGPDLTGIPNLSVSNVNNFYYMNSNSYQQVGIGADLNGIPTPIAFGNKDYIYNFPLNFGTNDSSASDYSLSIPGLGTYQARQNRVNLVDGWGTLITPYGTYNTLRIKSELTGTDSLYLDTLGFGFTLPRPMTHEYKWLANGQGVPLLQVNTQTVGPSESITSIRYRDNDTTVSTSVAELGMTNNWILYPNPSENEAILRSSVELAGNVGLRVTDQKGAEVLSVHVNGNVFKDGLNLNTLSTDFVNGIYTIDLQYGSSHQLMRWIRISQK